MRKIIIALCLLMLGCTHKHILDERWRPLEEIVDRPGYGENDWWSTTIGSSVYVADLEAWLNEKKPGGGEFEATLSHERVHAIRQRNLGVVKYIWLYLTDQKFRWYEEQLGWYVGLKIKDRYGIKWKIKDVVDSLRGYWLNLGTRPDIQSWVTKVKNGTWKPQKGELPEEYEGL